MKTKRNKFLFFVFALFFVFFLTGKNCLALVVSPTTVELTANPGQMIDFNIEIHNDNSKEREEFITSILNFNAKDNENGEPKFFSGDDFLGEDLASEWLEIESVPLVVEPSAWRKIPITIKIPQKVQPGGYYVAVFFGPKKNEEKSKDKISSVSYYAGSLVLINVSGETIQGGAVKEFSTEGGKKFFRNLPIGFFTRIENSGNLHFRPAGNVEIKNFWNKKVAQIPVIKSQTGGNILPESIRRYNLNWESACGEKANKNFFSSGFLERANRQRQEFYLGRYAAVLTVVLPNKETGTVSIFFWLIPAELLTVILVVLIILWALIYCYNRWIVGFLRSRVRKEPKRTPIKRKEKKQDYFLRK
jgi:hypothetical protein